MTDKTSQPETSDNDLFEKRQRVYIVTVENPNSYIPLQLRVFKTKTRAERFAADRATWTDNMQYSVKIKTFSAHVE